ncbi:hypothetical protein SDC9_201164 [bioreactor metagenome]|uniref:Uncharacterized protein n=1 Tax=bioreactor metagenome TaxID=1076179 RepID=A0A645IRD8_9ZZZZ
MQREHRTQVGDRTVLELGQPLHCVELNVGLGDTKVELTRLDGVDVVYRTAGALDRTADTVLGAVLVHQPADRPACGVIHAGDATRTDGDELLLGLGWSGAESAGNDQGCCQGAKCLHAFSSMVVTEWKSHRLASRLAG